MRRLRIHNKIARSNVTPLVCALLAAGLWWLPSGNYDFGGIISLALFLCTAYIVLEANNVFMILRVRSRMITSVWLFCAASLGMLHAFQPIMLAMFCLAVSYYVLFRTYQQMQPVADVFHAFLMLSLGSVFYPPLLFFVPFYWWYLLVFMRCMSLRVFFASLLGTILPYWFWLGWLLWQEDLSPFVAWWQGISMGNIRNVAMYADRATALLHIPYFLLLFLSLWMTGYYFIYRYDDKIRTRMMFYIFIFQTLLVILFSLFMAEPMQVVPLLLLSLAPLLAHYFTLCNTWLSLVLFLLSVLAFLGVAFQTMLPETFYKLC